MATWRERYRVYIEQLHAEMPKNATLDERIKYLKDHIPASATIYSHGKKAWQAARRDYLFRFGYVKRGTPKMPLFESPLDKQKRIGETRIAALKATKDK